MYWHAEIFENEYNDYCGIRGINSNNKSETLNLTSLEDIKDLPLKINNEYKLFDMQRNELNFIR